MENTVKPGLTIAEAKAILKCEFTKWCRLRSLNENTIIKLIEREVEDVRGLSYISSKQ